MIRTMTTAAFFFLCTVCITGSVVADEGKDKPSKVLEVDKSTRKLEVRQAQIGYRDTLLFYTFDKQKTVLKLRIDNRDKTFPMTGTVYVFSDKVTKDGLAKWLNNQHSDGLYPEVPKPISTIALPAKVCKVTSHKFLDHTKLRFGEYDNFAVTFEVKDYSKNRLELKGFNGATKVHIKTK